MTTSTSHVGAFGLRASLSALGASRSALAIALLASGLALSGCKSTGGAMPSGAAPLQMGAPLNPATARAMIEEWGRKYDSAPNDRTIALTYARALRASQRFPEATAVLQKLAATNSQDMEVLGAFGKSLADSGRLEEAATVLQGAHTPERPDWTVLSAQGSIADQMGDHENAQNYYNAALRMAPGEPSLLSNLGLSYALTKKLPLAEQTLRQAVSHPRADYRVRQNLALVLALQGKFQEAEIAQRADMSPEQSAANVASIRQMIAQSDAWRQIQSPAGGARPAGAPAAR